MKHYKLVDKKPIPCSLEEYGYWESIHERRISLTNLGSVDVSTVFLGIDHQFGEGKPILFETCIFGGEREGEITRYHTYDEALEGHKKIVESFNTESNICVCPNPCPAENYCTHSKPHKRVDKCGKTGGTFHCKGCIEVSKETNDKRNCRRIHLRT